MPYKNPEDAKAYRERSKDKKAAADKRYRESHAEEIKAQKRANSVQRAIWRKAWSAANKDRERESKRRWNRDNHQRIIAVRRVYRDKNREHLAQMFRAWVNTYPKYNIWMEANKDKRAGYAIKSAKVQLQKFPAKNEIRSLYPSGIKATQTPTRLMLLAKVSLCNGLCYICGNDIEPGTLSIDHVHPFKYSGTNDSWNLMPSHRRCNIKKRANLDYPIARPDLVARCMEVRLVNERKHIDKGVLAVPTVDVVGALIRGDYHLVLRAV